MKSFFWHVLFVFVLSTGLTAQKTAFDFTKIEHRQRQTQQLESMVLTTAALPFSDSLVKQWKGCFWAMQLMQYKPAVVQSQVPHWIKQMPRVGTSLQYALLETLNGVFPVQHAELLAQQWPFLSSDKNKAAAAAYLWQAGYPVETLTGWEFFITTTYGRSFRFWQGEQSQVLDATATGATLSRLLPGQNLLVSLQHRNRQKPGRLRLRLANGTWLKTPQGKIWEAPQLALSITQLPFFLTNGNSPQGLYRIGGIDTSQSIWIGPTPNLQLAMPLEKGVAQPFFDHVFFRAKSFSHAQAAYAALLGKAAADSSLWESFYAGQLGRSEIIAHGTTIPPEYYKGKTYFPHTPSLGCLCSPETWDASGRRSYSAQADWIRVYRAQKQQPAFLLVIDVPEDF